VVVAHDKGMIRVAQGVRLFPKTARGNMCAVNMFELNSLLLEDTRTKIKDILFYLAAVTGKNRRTRR